MTKRIFCILFVMALLLVLVFFYIARMSPDGDSALQNSSSNTLRLPTGKDTPSNPSKENRWAYKTISDEDALLLFERMSGVQLTLEDAEIVHSVERRGVYELGMRLGLERRTTILDDIAKNFQSSVAREGTLYEGWEFGPKTFYEETDINEKPVVLDGLQFRKWTSIRAAYSREGTRTDFSDKYMIFAIVDMEDGDFYIDQAPVDDD